MIKKIGNDTNFLAKYEKTPDDNANGGKCFFTVLVKILNDAKYEVTSNDAETLISCLLDTSEKFRMYGKNNIWIYKPGGLSRGRGIFLSTSVNEFKDKLWKVNTTEEIKLKTNKREMNNNAPQMSAVQIKANESQMTNGNQIHHMVCQKYLENPLLVYGFKFDIRQWIVVTTLMPLEIWINTRFYTRFSGTQYSAEPDKITDIFTHLTNNCVQKKAKDYSSNEELLGKGNMWCSDDFRAYLEKYEFCKPEKHSHTWSEFRQKMINLAISTLLAARNKSLEDQVTYSSNNPTGCGQVFGNSSNKYSRSTSMMNSGGRGTLKSPTYKIGDKNNSSSLSNCIPNMHFELYGFDYLIDENLDPWLLEVNSAPTLDQNTPTMKEIVPSSIDGLIEMVLRKSDWTEGIYKVCKSDNRFEQKKNPVGTIIKGWELIYKERINNHTNVISLGAVGKLVALPATKKMTQSLVSTHTPTIH